MECFHSQIYFFTSSRRYYILIKIFGSFKPNFEAHIWQLKYKKENNRSGDLVFGKGSIDVHLKSSNGCHFFLNQGMEDSFNKSINIKIFTALEQVVYNLNNENFVFSVQQTMNLFDANFPYSFILAICMLVLAAFASQRGEFETYLNYLKLIQTKEEETNISHHKIIDIFWKRSDLKNSGKFVAGETSRSSSSVSKTIHHLKDHVKHRFDFIRMTYFDIFMIMK